MRIFRKRARFTGLYRHLNICKEAAHVRTRKIVFLNTCSIYNKYVCAYYICMLFMGSEWSTRTRLVKYSSPKSRREIKNGFRFASVTKEEISVR